MASFVRLLLLYAIPTCASGCQVLRKSILKCDALITGGIGLEISSLLAVVDIVTVAFFSGSDDPVEPAESLLVADVRFTW